MNPDYDSLWEQQMRRTFFRGDGVAFWNETARRYENVGRVSNYNNWLTEHMALPRDGTVLDVGCGTGSLSFALAGKVRQVTALDISPVMLKMLTQDAACLKLKNVRVLCQDWEGAEIGKDVTAHDVVIASRSLPMGNLRRTLVKLDQAARQSAYVTWPAGGNETDAALCAILGLEYHPSPDYRLITAILDSLGIKAMTRTFTVTGRYLFTDLTAALEHSLRGRKIDPELEEKVRAYLVSHLVFENGYYRRETENLWALVEWHKCQDEAT